MNYEDHEQREHDAEQGRQDKQQANYHFFVAEDAEILPRYRPRIREIYDYFNSVQVLIRPQACPEASR